MQTVYCISLHGIVFHYIVCIEKKQTLNMIINTYIKHEHQKRYIYI